MDDEPADLFAVVQSNSGLSASEVAECLSIPEETVRTRFFRARRALQQQLERQLLTSVPELYGFHLLRCDRIVSAVLAHTLISFLFNASILGFAINVTAGLTGGN